PARCYLLGSRVEHDFDQRYPVFIAPTGSCAEAGSSVSLCIRSDPQSLQVAVSPCCIQLLPSVISADLSSDPWTPTTVADKVLLPVSSPVTSAFPKFPTGRLNHKSPLDDFRAGDAYAAAVIRYSSGLRVCCHSGRSHRWHLTWCQGGRGVYIRAERGFVA